VFEKHAGEIAAVLLDVTMPKARGDEVFEELQRIRPNVPVIFTSGFTQDDVAAEFMGMPVVGFLQKPFGGAELLTEVRRLVGNGLA
jgi:FixJ family two-component response regulator